MCPRNYLNPPRNGEGDHNREDGYGGGAAPQASGVRGTLPPSAHPEPVEGAPTEADAEAGMAHMSQLYRDGGNELYIGAGDREHD